MHVYVHVSGHAGGTALRTSNHELFINAQLPILPFLTLIFCPSAVIAFSGVLVAVAAASSLGDYADCLPRVPYAS